MPNTSCLEPFDFRPIGKAIKAARDERNWTRDQTAEMLGITGGYLAAIENKGQNPGFGLFISLVTLFDLSADELILSATTKKLPTKSSLRRQLDLILDSLSDEDLLFIKTLWMAHNTWEATRAKKRNSNEL